MSHVPLLRITGLKQAWHVRGGVVLHRRWGRLTADAAGASNNVAPRPRTAPANLSAKAGEKQLLGKLAAAGKDAGAEDSDGDEDATARESRRRGEMAVFMNEAYTTVHLQRGDG